MLRLQISDREHDTDFPDCTEMSILGPIFNMRHLKMNSLSLELQILIPVQSAEGALLILEIP